MSDQTPDKFVWEDDSIIIESTSKLKQLINKIKAWPTREERLRKSMVVKQPEAKADDDIGHTVGESDNSTESERKRRARQLKLRSNQRKRRLALSLRQRERGEVPEAKI